MRWKRISIYDLKKDGLKNAAEDLEKVLEKRGLFSAEKVISVEHDIYVKVILFTKQILHREPLSYSVQRSLPSILRYIIKTQENIPMFCAYPVSLFLKRVMTNDSTIKIPLTFYQLWSVYCELFRYQNFNAYFFSELHRDSGGSRVFKTSLIERFGRDAFLGTASVNIANYVLSHGINILDVDAHLKLPMSQLRIDVWNCLLSEHSKEWILRHSYKDIQEFLEQKKDSHSDSIILIMRVILEEWVRRGVKVSNMQRGTNGSLVLTFFKSLLPVSQNQREWRLLGEQAKGVFYKWKVIHLIEDCFSSWDATDTQRKRFWSRHLDDIVDIHHFKTAEALGMKINDRWFVEFGKINNACYSYRQSDWERHDFQSKDRRKQIKNPNQLKDYPWDKKNHSRNWPLSFDAWIFYG